MSTIRGFLPYFSVALLAFFFISCGQKEEEPETVSGDAMGTTWTLSTRGTAAKDPKPIVTDVLEKWENVTSPWRPESDLSLLNSGKPATPELQRVIDLAVAIQEITAGAFNPRLLRETSAAGFGPKGIGMDLSGIGKGFAVDRVVEALRDAGFKDFVFELGGEVFAHGGEWEIGIELPDPAKSTVFRTVKLRDRALATSGNYRQFNPAPEGLSSHIIDPKTLLPIVRPACSVTVIADDCATADAWATALFVLGPDVPAQHGLDVTWNFPVKEAPEN